MSTISASTTSTTGFKVTSDTTGTLVLQTGASPTTALTLSSAQIATFVNDTVVNGVTIGKGGGSGTNNVVLGQSPFATATTGANNILIGGSAGYGFTTASGNVGVGYNVFGNGTTVTATNNVGIGLSALASITTADNSVAVGYQAGYSNQTGTGITAIGSLAAYNTTGSYNLAVGTAALYANTTGTGNTSVGPGATYANMRYNTTGSYNTSVGAGALALNTVTSDNTAVGYQAGYNATQGQNTFLGKQAGYSNANGAYNTFIGYQAGYLSNPASPANTYNCFVGLGAGYFVTTGSKNTILGAYNGNQGGLDIRTSSNYIVISDGDGYPRGIFNPSGYMKFSNDANFLRSLGGTFHEIYQTVANTGLAITAASTSMASDVLFIGAARNTTNGTFNAIRYYNDGAGAERFKVIDSGAIYSTSTSITSISDGRFKENVSDLDKGLDAVMALQPRRFDWKEGKGEDRKNAMGFIAQEFQQVFPDLTQTWKQNEEDPTEYLAIRQGDLIPALVKAIQEQQAIIETLTNRITALEAK